MEKSANKTPHHTQYKGKKRRKLILMQSFEVLWSFTKGIDRDCSAHNPKNSKARWITNTRVNILQLLKNNSNNAFENICPECFPLKFYCSHTFDHDLSNQNWLQTKYHVFSTSFVYVSNRFKTVVPKKGDSKWVIF